jgi:hypothetical protein
MYVFLVVAACVSWRMFTVNTEVLMGVPDGTVRHGSGI